MDKANLGTQVALTAYNVAPLAADIIGRMDTTSGWGFTVKGVDTTGASDTSGWATNEGLYKEWKEVTITVYKNNANIKQVFNKVLETKPTAAGYKMDLSLIYPKGDDWTDVKDTRMHGYISDFEFNDVNKDEIQKFTFKFKGSGAPILFDGSALIPNEAAYTDLTTAG